MKLKPPDALALSPTFGRLALDQWLPGSIETALDAGLGRQTKGRCRSASEFLEAIHAASR